VVEAVDRALKLLTALSDAGPAGASLAELAAPLGINKATAHRALSTMRLRGFALQDHEGGHYRLGPAAFDLADRAYSPASLAQALHPSLVALSAATEELVHLGVLVGDHVLYVDKVEPARAIRVWSSVGQQVPVASTSMGRALLAARGVPDELLSGYLRHLPAGRAVAQDRLREAVADARRFGYAVEVGENEPGVACIGTAVMHGSTAIAALSITAPTTRMTARRQRQLAGMIVSEVTPLLPPGLALMASLAER
jgi:DNA-binding IclR family transcriptional regulator